MSSWVVIWDSDAVDELSGIKEKRTRRDLLKVADKLQRSGPALREPHAKSVKASNGLGELRPNGGQSTLRLLYAQTEETNFVILAIAPEANVKPQGFRSAVEKAQRRVERYQPKTLDKQPQT